MDFVQRNFLLLVGAAVMAAFLAGCAGMSYLHMPAAEDVLHAGPLAKILVYAGNVPLGGSGGSVDRTTINIGGTAVFSAQGRDVNSKPIAITPTWTASKPELVEISPKVGSMVAVKGLREGTTEIVVEYLGVKRKVNYIFVKP